MRREKEGFMEIEYAAWLLPRCFKCDNDILLLTKSDKLGHMSQLLEFGCGCTKKKIVLQSDYIKAEEDVVILTLFLNGRLSQNTVREASEWLNVRQGINYTEHEYNMLKRKILLRDV